MLLSTHSIPSTTPFPLPTNWMIVWIVHLNINRGKKTLLEKEVVRERERENGLSSISTRYKQKSGSKKLKKKLKTEVKKKKTVKETDTTQCNTLESNSMLLLFRTPLKKSHYISNLTF